jgi:hypothetical protein
LAPEPVWITLGRKNSCLYRDSNSDPSAVQPIASRAVLAADVAVLLMVRLGLAVVIVTNRSSATCANGYVVWCIATVYVRTVLSRVVPTDVQSVRSHYHYIKHQLAT